VAVSGDPARDLDAGDLAATLGDRPVRTYPALLSTEAVAMAWARDGAPSGAVVVADYQASPRGRGGLPWTVQPGVGLGCTLLLRPELAPEREGWPYVAALLALHDALDRPDAQLAWPDEVHDGGGTPLARLGAYVELGPMRTEWVSLTVLVEDARPPRGNLLARLVSALEQRMSEPGARGYELFVDCFERGLLVRATGDIIAMSPPLILEENHIDQIVDTLAAALQRVV